MTSTRTLLTQCGWLSVKQMIVYFSLTLLHRIFYEKKPEYIYKRITPTRHMRHTRYTDHTTLETKTWKTATAKKSFIQRSTVQWNNLPLNIKEIQNKEAFKTKLKIYIQENIPIK